MVFITTTFLVITRFLCLIFRFLFGTTFSFELEPILSQVKNYLIGIFLPLFYSVLPVLSHPQAKLQGFLQPIPYCSACASACFHFKIMQRLKILKSHLPLKYVSSNIVKNDMYSLKLLKRIL